MVDTTTAKDLAEKIEWIGFSNLSCSEHAMVGQSLREVSLYMPRLLALALWKYYGEDAPLELATRGSACSLDSFARRNAGRQFISEIMADYKDEEG